MKKIPLAEMIPALVFATGAAMAGCAAALAAAALVQAALAQTASIPGVVEVYSDHAEYLGDRSVFSGNVTLAAGKMTLAADRLEVQIGENGNHYRASGQPVRIQCPQCFGRGAAAQAESVRYADAQGTAVAAGGAVVCVGKNCRGGKLSAHQLEWRRGENVFIARGDPALADSEKSERLARAVWNPPGGESVSVSAREIRYDFRAQTAFLSGDAEAVRGESSLRGDTIVFNRQTGAMRAEAAPNERVRAVFGLDNGGEKKQE